MAWKTLDPLPVARYRHASVAHKDKIYVAGGASAYDLSAMPVSILKCRVDSGGDSNTPWTSCAPDFATGKLGCQIKVVGNEFLMVLGGVGITPTALGVEPGQDIHVGKIDADGNIPTWTRLAGALPTPMVDFGVAVHNQNIFLLGGTQVSVSLVYKTQAGVNFTVGQVVTGTESGAFGTLAVDTDGGATGTLRLTAVTGVFINGEQITDPLGGVAIVNGLQSAVKLDYDAQLVNFTAGKTVKGLTSTATGLIVSDADAGATGVLTLSGVTGNFTNNEKLVVEHADAQGVLSTNFYLKYDTQTGAFTVGQVVSGAGGATGTIAADVEDGDTGTLELTGIVGDFVAGENLTDPITGAAKVVASTTQYKTLSYDAQTINFVVGQVVAGITSGAVGTIQADADAGAAGVLDLKTITGVFQNNEKLAVEYADANETQYQTLVYQGQNGNFTVGQVVTGTDSTAHGLIASQTDAGATGTLILTSVVGTFINDEVLTDPLGGIAAADGTQAFNNVATAAIYRAKIDSSGQPGGFSLVASVLPAAITPGAAVAKFRDRILIVNSTSMYSARVMEGGELGPWSSVTTGLTRTVHSLVKIQNDDLLIIGGYDGANTIPHVNVTSVEADGTTRVWQQTTPLNTARRLAAVAQLGDRVYVSGGASGANAVLTTVEVAHVNSDGQINGQRS